MMVVRALLRAFAFVKMAPMLFIMLFTLLFLSKPFHFSIILLLL
jgi:hypothetical protein